MAFFQESEILKNRREPTSNAAKCGVCLLYKKCESPKMSAGGSGRKKILIVGPAPSEEEDDSGRFGYGGKDIDFLEDALQQVDIDLHEDCWYTGALICSPPDGREPTKDEIKYCHPNLKKLIQKNRPHVILAMGHTGISSVLKGVWTKSIGPVQRWSGTQIPCGDLGAWVLPIHHPSYIRHERDRQKGGSAAPAVFMNHLKGINKALKKSVPEKTDWESKVEILDNEDAIAHQLRVFQAWAKPICFDYETTTLKPEGPKSRIRSVSVCSGGLKTVAFLFKGDKVKNALSELLADKRVPKIGFNLKFEDRWTNTVLGTPVRNWIWDGMIQAHVINPQSQICSLDFQSFTLLGVPTYSNHISSLLSSDGSYSTNRIKEVATKDLLVYNGLDSLAGYLVARKQMKHLNMRVKI